MNQRPCTVVSNRLPFTLRRTAKGFERKPSVGGLASALDRVLSRGGGTWIGWPGLVLRGRETPELNEPGAPYHVGAVMLTEAEVERYYHGFANRTLWPLFHSLPERAQFQRRDWETYVRVNARFATAALDDLAEQGLLWVHDYHLMLAPGQIRVAAPHARIAFFLHIPFPPYDLFRLLPWDREILQGLLACDLVGFHVGGYAQNFLDCVERRLGARVDRDAMLVYHGNRTIQVGAFPIGIDYPHFEGLARAAAPMPRENDVKVVLGVDRLDYTKGIPERIHAFARLLELHPEHRERVMLLQLAVPSRSQVREYRTLKREIDRLVGEVNGRFATATWSPIRYLYRAMPQEELAGLYRDADVALITPLRDGMNLVAKEYVACQVDDPGVLILSRLAGAAETMHEALLVNPYNDDETAAALHRALRMGEAERRSRMAALRRREARYDLRTWVESFFEEATAHPRAEHELPAASDFAGWLDRFIDNHHLAIFLDYDGTLAPLGDRPDSGGGLSPAMRDAIQACVARPDTDLGIVSRRTVENVRGNVGLSELAYAGSAGLEISGPGIADFEHEDLQHYRERIRTLSKQLEPCIVAGAWIEQKGATLTFHLDAVPQAQRAELSETVCELIGKAGFLSRSVDSQIEAQPPVPWGKGQAVLHILRARYGPAWSETVRVIYIGDDETDEEAFKLLQGLAHTFRVGGGIMLTEAKRYLPNVQAVEALLRWIAVRPARSDERAA